MSPNENEESERRQKGTNAWLPNQLFVCNHGTAQFIARLWRHKITVSRGPRVSGSVSFKFISPKVKTARSAHSARETSAPSAGTIKLDLPKATVIHLKRATCPITYPGDRAPGETAPTDSHNAARRRTSTRPRGGDGQVRAR